MPKRTEQTDYSTLRWIREGEGWAASMFADGIVLSCEVVRKEGGVYSALCSAKTRTVKEIEIIPLGSYAPNGKFPPKEWTKEIYGGLDRVLDTARQGIRKAEFERASAPRCGRKCRWYGGAWCMTSSEMKPTTPGYRCTDFAEREKTSSTGFARRKI